MHLTSYRKGKAQDVGQRHRMKRIRRNRNQKCLTFYHGWFCLPIWQHLKLLRRHTSGRICEAHFQKDWTERKELLLSACLSACLWIFFPSEFICCCCSPPTLSGSSCFGKPTWPLTLQGTSDHQCTGLDCWDSQLYDLSSFLVCSLSCVQTVIVGILSPLLHYKLI